MRGDTKVVSLDGTQPTIENIKNGTYTLARKLYFITLGEPKPGAKAFIDYVLSADGQKIATRTDSYRLEVVCDLLLTFLLLNFTLNYTIIFIQ